MSAAQPATSRRRMTPLRRMVYRGVLVPLGVALIKAFWMACRAPRVVGRKHLENALASAPSLIPAYWHQHQLFCAKVLVESRALGLKPGYLISPSVDGEIGAMVIERFGCHPIRGSSTHTGARALRDFYEALTKLDVSPVITPDGPRGPRFVFKPGAVLLAQMSGRPILPMAYAASHATLFHWDKFVLPWPLSRIVVAIGEPVYIPRGLDAAGLEGWQRQMELVMKRTYQLAAAELHASR